VKLIYVFIIKRCLYPHYSHPPQLPLHLFAFNALMFLKNINNIWVMLKKYLNLHALYTLHVKGCLKKYVNFSVF
jgi:hypothetical protein